MPNPGTPDWLTVKVCPATVSVAERAAPKFAAIPRFTCPAVVPVIVIQTGFPDTAQEQPVVAETDTDMGPPAAGTLCELEPSENEQVETTKDRFAARLVDPSAPTT